MAKNNRQEKALELIRCLSSDLGLRVEAPKVINDSSYICIRVNQSLLARVKLFDESFNDSSRVYREVRVASFLADCGAPVVQFAQGIEPGPYKIDNSFIMLLRFETLTKQQVLHYEVGKSLSACHQYLKSYGEPLPNYLDDINLCFNHLKGFKDRTFLSSRDYGFLTNIGGALIEKVIAWKVENPTKEYQPLHGDPHLGNILNTKNGLLWCDFESVCYGPVEWDLSSLPETALESFQFDSKLLETMRLLRSWVVAAWCWMYYERSQDKKDAATFHLERLKKSLI
ncbi:phosphotransferase [Aliikangiella marina]|uniref:Phosphotransferase n=1 Tax=Aliikangiella marina TaxID=1712262 RepID=A0A545TEB4_9GAMM|nr:phosphotransferase [Aliikangiella marina]TQV75563.1 phosphotransferase [Aliikangiella marina]